MITPGFWTNNIRIVLYGSLVAAALTCWLFIKAFKRGQIATRPSTPDLEKPGTKRSQSSKAPVRPP